MFRNVRVHLCGFVWHLCCHAFLSLPSIVAFRMSTTEWEKISKNVNRSIQAHRQKTKKEPPPLELFSLNPIFRLYLISYAAKSLKQNLHAKLTWILNISENIWQNCALFCRWNKWLCSKEEDEDKKNVCVFFLQRSKRKRAHSRHWHC